jgi:hypothetical protein
MRAMIVLLVLAASPAYAGRQQFGWLYGTEINPVRTVEMETWIQEENQKGDDKANETLIWWSPVVGVTDHLEVAFPIEFNGESNVGEPIVTNLLHWGVEGRYRFNSPDPVEAGPFVVAIRGGVKRIVGDRGSVRGEADLMMSYEKGPVFVEIDLGGVGENAGMGDYEFRPAAGIAYRATSEIRLGAAMYSELRVAGDPGVVSWLSVGPNVAWAHGRFWIAVQYGIGIFGIRDAPRLSFGTSF